MLCRLPLGLPQGQERETLGNRVAKDQSIMQKKDIWMEWSKKTGLLQPGKTIFRCEGKVRLSGPAEELRLEEHRAIGLPQTREIQLQLI